MLQIQILKLFKYLLVEAQDRTPWNKLSIK